MYYIKNQSISVIFFQLEIKMIFDSNLQFKEHRFSNKMGVKT